MTFEELLEAAKAANAEFRQYDRRLRPENCSRRIAVRRKSMRGRAWFEKGDAVLQCGWPKQIDYVGDRVELYVTIWSPSAASFCLVPERLFERT